MKIALAMIVKPSDKEATILSRCLNSVSEYVDGIYITQAGPKPNKKVSDVIKFYNGVESFFKWVNDFSKARNFNFSQVPKEYDHILWLDADDVLRNGDKIKKMLEDNPATDSFSFWYLYAFDEWKNPVVVHHKTRVLRNDDCVEWVGALHEDFNPKRQIDSKHVEGIDVLHLSDEQQREQSKERNLVVALSQMKNEPKDPRSFWNVGNSYKAQGNDRGAIKYFAKFIKTSKSDDEKYIVRLRMAESHWNLGDHSKAIEQLQFAIGTRPGYPDAYILLGKLYYHIEKYQEAIDHLKAGIKAKPPYYSIIVYNPRDYDYEPLRWLAYCYIAMHQPTLALPCMEAMLEITPKDKKLAKTIKAIKKQASRVDKVNKLYSELKDVEDKDLLVKKLAEIDPEIRSHPLLCHLRNSKIIKQKSSGHDLVYFCGYTERQWTPDSLSEGIGGSEEAVIHLTNRLSKLGWNITVYNNCGHESKVFDGVTYKPYWEWNYRDKQDVTVIWRHPRMADFKINSNRVYLDMHDALKAGELTEKRLNNLDKIFIKSKAHRVLYPNVDDSKFVIIPNGIESEKFSGEYEKDPYLLVNTSSPDRSLGVLIDLFKEVKKQVPEAKLKWAYGWGVFDTVHKADAEVMGWKDKITKKMQETDGVEDLGRISQEEVGELYRKGRVFAYPSEFYEIDCISLTKAIASGCTPVTTDFAAMGEKITKTGTFLHSPKTKDDWVKPYQYDFSLEGKELGKQWVEAVVKTLKSPIGDDEEDRQWAQETFNWDKITNQWNNIINGSNNTI